MSRWLALLILSVPVFGADIIHDSRRVNWRRSEVGLMGPLPTNRTVFTTITSTGDTTDRTATIETALNVNCPSNQVVLLGAGDFYTTGIDITKSGVTLKGSGVGVTRIISTGSGDWVVKWATGSHDYDFTTTEYTPTSGFTKGSTSMTFSANPTTWAVGDLIAFTEQEDNTRVDKDGNSGNCTWCGMASGVRCRGVNLEITAISGADVTFRPELDMDFTSGLSPRAREISNPIRMSGLESLTVTNAAGLRDTFVMEGAFKCWTYDVEARRSDRRHVWIYDSMNCEWRRTTFREGNGADWGAAYGADAAYGIIFSLHNSNHLVEDCAFDKLSFPIALEGANSWHVITHNYFGTVMNNTVHDPKPAIGAHGAHPQMILVEYNYAESKMSLDRYWGSSGPITFHRNRWRMAGTQNGTVPTQYVIELDIWRQSYSNNIVGNVIGRLGFETTYDVPDGASVNTSSTTKSIRRIGSLNANDTDYSEYDNSVTNSLLWKRNYDVVTGGVVDEGAGSETNLTVSYFDSSKPAFYRSLTFPPIYLPVNDDENDPILSDAAAEFVPAGYRFLNNGDDPPEEAGGAAGTVTLGNGTITVGAGGIIFQ